MASVGSLSLSWGADILAGALWGLFAGALLTLSLRSFFFPTRIRLDDEGITVKEPLFTRTRSWSSCKSLHLDRFGVLVSPFSFPTRLENYRGVYLRFSDNREQVLAFCRRHMNLPDDET